MADNDAMTGAMAMSGDDEPAATSAAATPADDSEMTDDTELPPDPVETETPETAPESTPEAPPYTPPTKGAGPGSLDELRAVLRANAAKRLDGIYQGPDGNPLSGAQAAEMSSTERDEAARQYGYQNTTKGAQQKTLDYTRDPSRGQLEEQQSAADISEDIEAKGAERQLTVDQYTRAQAVETIVGNLVKAFAAYKGFQSGRDMSGVDPKTGIDWGMAMRGKLSNLSDETEELRGQRMQKYRDLATRLQLAKTETVEGDTELQRQNQQAIGLYRTGKQAEAQGAAAQAKAEHAAFMEQQTAARTGIMAARQKTSEEYRKWKMGDTSVDFKDTIESYDDEEKLSRSTLKDIKLVGPETPQTTKNEAAIQKAEGAVRDRLNIPLNTEMTTDDILALTPRVKAEIAKDRDASIYLKSAVSRVKTDPDAASAVGAAATFGGPRRLQANIPSGSVYIPKTDIWNAMSQDQKMATSVGRHGFTGSSFKMDQVEKAEQFDVTGQGPITKFKDTTLNNLSPGQIKALMIKYPNARMGIGSKRLAPGKPTAEMAPEATGESLAFNEGIVKPRIPEGEIPEDESAGEPSTAQTTI